MTRSVEKSNRLAFVFHAVGADVLCNPARFPGSYPRFPNRIHQGSFAVIDMAHESDDGRAGLEFLLFRRLPEVAEQR